MGIGQTNVEMKQYYYINARREQVGPVEIDLLTADVIRRDTLVWYAGLTNWTPAANLPELAHLFNTGVPPIPPAGPTPPQAPRQAATSNPKPESYMWLAILTTILCCLPAGIVSIVYASKVDSCWVSGDYEGARYNSDKAKTWGIISAVAAAAVFVIYFAFVAACIPFI